MTSEEWNPGRSAGGDKAAAEEVHEAGVGLEIRSREIVDGGLDRVVMEHELEQLDLFGCQVAEIAGQGFRHMQSRPASRQFRFQDANFIQLAHAIEDQ